MQLHTVISRAFLLSCAAVYADAKPPFISYFVCLCTGVSGVTGEKGPTGDSGEYNKNILDVTFANGIRNGFCESNLLAATAANANDQTDATTLHRPFPALFAIVQDH